MQGIDAKRISDFATFYYIIAQTIVKLIISIWFLVELLGWRSLLAGLAIFVILLPLNVYVSKGYSDAQGVLMKLRDQKMVVVTEALQGIRQIKFSAQEQQWQEKISKKREDELRTQWRVFSFDTALIAVWILGPVMLSAVSLAVYALLHDVLPPSVAFTALTVMAAIEVNVLSIPKVSVPERDFQ